MVLHLAGAADFNPRQLADVGVAGLVDVIHEARFLLFDDQGLAVGRRGERKVFHQLAAPHDRLLGRKSAFEDIRAGRGRAEQHEVMEVIHQRFGHRMLTNGVSELSANAQVREGNRGLSGPQKTLIRVGRHARVDLRWGQCHRLGAGLCRLGVDDLQLIRLGKAEVNARQHLSPIVGEDGVAVSGGAIGAGVFVEMAGSLRFACQGSL